MFDHPLASFEITGRGKSSTSSLPTHPLSKAGYWILGLCVLLLMLCQTFFIFAVVAIGLFMMDLSVYVGRMRGPPLVPSFGMALIVLGIGIRIAESIRSRLRSGQRES